MAEDKKAAGHMSGHERHQPPEGGKGARKRAPDQDVLPGILGKQLRAAYSELLNAPIPDQFTELIKRLEGKELAGQRAKSEKPDPEESDR